MPGYKELDETVTIANQVQSREKGPVVLINVFTVDPADREALVAAWAHDAEFMKAQPGYILTQLHEGIAGSSTYINYAVWESVESFRAAFATPEFNARIAEYPQSAVTSPHLFKKVAVPGLCLA
ncbi:MAG: antibiotic biosynthesis monooxygenase [Deltaproteobacteria bacterium]|nr:antibiotic biosynthesis monooxygenase [Deltaproteobacteria bacterium]